MRHDDLNRRARLFSSRMLTTLASSPLWVVLIFVFCQAQGQQLPAPIERRTPSTSKPTDNPLTKEKRGPQGEHLAEWMNQHSNLSPQQQRQALEQLPGFQELPKDTQLRYLNRLAHLDAMSPQRRERVLARTEAMESLNPDQRAQVRGAMAELGHLPQEERRTVARTFRELRELPQEQRLAALDAGRFGPPLSAEQRTVLMNLLRVEPLMGAMLLPRGSGPAQNAIPSMGLR